MSETDFPGHFFHIFFKKPTQPVPGSLCPSEPGGLQGAYPRFLIIITCMIVTAMFSGTSSDC